MKLYEQYIKSLGLEVDVLDYLEDDLAQYTVTGRIKLPDNTERDIRYISFHPDHTDGPCAKLMVESGEVVWTKEIKLV